MKPTVLLTTIVNRSKSEKFAQFFLDNGTPVVLRVLGIGTATNDILDYLGIGESEKQILFSVLTEEKAKQILKQLDKRMKLYIPGNGISYTIKLNSFAGMAALQNITGDMDIAQDEIAAEEADSNMDNSNQYELIVAVTNRGYVDEVMDAARAAQARGGTVIHALGTGREQAEQFFGISIAKEKDMILIVSTTAGKNEIMKAIVAEAGVRSKAHAIVFSLPVSDIAGIRIESEE